eukprot:TRINITY_DN8944_c1_g2_i3.p1 TRINITY_DN8944_c1_g2~~TRINITY_DN8944_c1_g2_i3.p1  ORF type:complete len:107 (+),score=2.03 TRINITY_DN8944_c1_g2_i3:518-838(+)
MGCFEHVRPQILADLPLVLRFIALLLITFRVVWFIPNDNGMTKQDTEFFFDPAPRSPRPSGPGSAYMNSAAAMDVRERPAIPPLSLNRAVPRVQFQLPVLSDDSSK